MLYIKQPAIDLTKALEPEKELCICGAPAFYRRTYRATSAPDLYLTICQNSGTRGDSSSCSSLTDLRARKINATYKHIGSDRIIDGVQTDP